MISIGIGLGTLGYGLVYFGAQVWKGTPVTMAYAFGFAQTNTAKQPTGGSSSTTSKVERSIAGGIGTVLLGPLGGLLGTL